MIIVAGVPGVGKSTLVSRLVRSLNLLKLSIPEIVLEEGAWSEYDSMRRTFYIDAEKLVASIRRRVRSVGSFIVFESTDVYTLWEAGVEPIAVIVLRCDPRILYNRLVLRNWPMEKLVENLEAELVGVVSFEARRLYGTHRVCEIDTTRKSPAEVETRVLRFIVNFDVNMCEEVNWIDNLAIVEFVSSLSLRTRR